METKNFAIGVLSTTAVILFVGILVLQSSQQPVRADGMTLVAGEYSMSVGAVTRNDEDLVYLIDSSAERLIVYRFDTTRKEIQLVQGLSMKEMRDNAGSGSATPTTPGKKQPAPPKKKP